MQQRVWKLGSCPSPKKDQSKIDCLVDHILRGRGITTPKQKELFLNPRLEAIFEEIPFPELPKALKRIKQAIASQEQITIFSDYDADGICATAILWETIKRLGGNVKPYVPDRMSEGYGLSTRAVEFLAQEGTKLIITVDNGITAVEPVEAAKKLGVDVIITDHHQIPAQAPKPYATVWSDQICGTGVAWVVAKGLQDNPESRSHLDLAALATIADVMPLIGYNRALVVEGLKELNQTSRVGLIAMLEESGVTLGTIDSWTIGHVIAPRINAMGRLENAVDSLRLLVTNNPLKAKSLAMMLAKTNSERQKLTEKMVGEAKIMYTDDLLVGVLAHESWHEGVVGLVAGRMTEAFYRPMVAIAKRKEISKGSARSIPGFNIIEVFRSLDGVFENVGGHPMAAGFTIRTDKIEELTKQLTKIAKAKLQNGLLKRQLTIDAELQLHDITMELYSALSILAPFGNGNPEPVFMTKSLVIEDIRKVGANGKHVKLTVCEQDADQKEMAAEVTDYTIGNYLKQKPFFEAIGFGMGETLATLRPGDVVDIAYTISLNTFRSLNKLELKIRDMRLSR